MVCESLERRTLLTVTPSSVLTKANRQEIIDHWVGSNKATLQTKLNTSNAAFDNSLLGYMTGRAGQSFFWNTSDVAGIKTFVNANIATSTTVSNADSIVAHMFPNGTTGVYDQNLGSGDVNWKTTGSDANFVHTLNRMDFWQDLAQSYTFTGNANYVTELINELASWSQQSPALSDPNAWASSDPPWQPLDVAERSDNWVWAYQMVLGSAGWTSDANTLFIWKLYQHGDFLRKVTPYALSSNRSLFEATGLLEIAQLMPEFDNASDWETYGRNLLFGAMDGQLNADGGHAESSPGYAGQVIDSLLEMNWLDQKKGDSAAWTGTRLTQLQNAAESYVQLLSPNSKLDALSDTYRQTSDTFWLHPRLILNDTTDFPAAKPRLRDVWLFGTTTANGLLGAPITPTMPNRGTTYSMPQSGYYVMRSGSDTNARQITFDAGPTGGQHGHYDLLNFELDGYGKPLISDPGLYTYDTSARRNWAISTPAHNTISIDNASHAALEGVTNPGLYSSGFSSVAGGEQITASHRAYQGLNGGPVVTRSIWYDGDGTMVIVDWAESSASHSFTTSFLIPGTTTSRDLAAGWIRSGNASGNVKIQSVLQAGQTAFRDVNITGTSTPVFTSDDPSTNIANAATRFHVDQTGTFACFITLVTAYSGSSASFPDITAALIGTPSAGGTFQVKLTRGGIAAETISFAEPPMARPGDDFRPAAPIAGANDVAWDSSGRLHLVFQDTSEQDLKCSVRDTSGHWSIVQTIDAGHFSGGYPSLAIDSHGTPAVAYFDGNGGDLKFAKLVSGAWQVETVDSAGSVGLYPSLVFSRNDGAMISYYKRTTGDLRLAVQVTGGWQISNVDTTGDVGRITSMTLDPNRPTASKVAIAYDDATTGGKKFAIQSGSGWSIQSVDTSTPNGGGYTSLSYEPYKDTDGTYHPTMSYYDSSNSALKFARLTTGTTWAASTLISTGVQGLYTSLFYDVGSRPNIFFFKKTNNTAYRAVKKNGAWQFTYLDTGGREMQVAKKADGSLGYTNLDVDGLRTEFLAS